MEINCVSDGLCVKKNRKMSQKVQMLRSLVEQRLTAAAEEIFGVVERTIVEYEDELCRTKEENQRQKQKLDSFLNPQVVAHPPGVGHLPVFKEDILSEQEEDWTSPSADPEPSLMKEEQEEMRVSDTEQLTPLSELVSTLASPESHPSGLGSLQSQNTLKFLDPESPSGKRQRMNVETLQLVESVLTTKPGGEQIIHEYNETQTLSDSSRRKMVKILTSDMTENGTSPSREVKDMYARGNVTLFPNLRDPLSKNGYTMAQTGQPAKARAQKRLKSFQDKSSDWARSMRRNRNVSHFLDNVEVTIEKMKALGLRPFLLYSIYDEKFGKYESKVICPYDCSEEVTKKMMENIEQLYTMLLEAWTPQDEQSRRKEKRKGKRKELLGEEHTPFSGNQGPTSGEEGAAVPERGEERPTEPERGKSEPPVSVPTNKQGIVQRRTRRPRWQPEEIQVLLNAAMERRDDLMAAHSGPGGNNQQRQAAQQQVADCVNSVSPYARTMTECVEKLRYFVSDAKIKVQQLKNLINHKGKRRKSGGEMQDGADEGSLAVQDNAGAVDVEGRPEEGPAGPVVKEMKIFFKKRRQWSRGGETCPCVLENL